jgi:long-chain acyl-CoA synthetase
MLPSTLNELFLDGLARHRGHPAAMRRKQDDAWRDISHRELHRRVRNVHAALRDLGLVAGDRVAILSENRPEWAITDFACLTARCTDVPIYPTLPAHQIAYVLRDSGSRIVCCSSTAQLEKVLEVRGELPSLEWVVIFDDIPARDGVLGFAELERRGAETADDRPEWESEALEVTADDLATLIYTSGTTGDPKGVMLSHGNITSNVVAALEVLELRADDSCLSFLPLSHIFERMVGHYTMFYAGVVIHYASSMEAISAETREVRPTVMASVPRLYEKIYARVVETATHGGGLTRAIFEWARATAEKRLEYRLAQRPVPAFLRVAYAVADLLVWRKFRSRLGGRLRFFVSGGAPLNPDICAFFLGAGLPILEGYGLTETSPVITVNRLERIKPGTVGPPIPGVEVRIADDGEILTRGPHVMQGYFNKPEATAAAIDPDGWFHTGDIGMLDADGYLRITDRKKDLIVTAGGKNIAPQPIEALLKTNGYLANAVMIGDRRRFPSMLLVPNFEVVRNWSRIKGLPELPDEALVARPEVQQKLEREARKSLRDLAHFEMPKKFLILPRDFSIDTGELTPKMSVKRKVVEQQWHEQIEALYADDEP